MLDDETGEFVFQAPPGVAAIHLSAGGWIHAPDEKSPDSFFGTNIRVPTSGPHRVTFRMVKAGSVRVTLKGDSADIVGEEIEVSIDRDMDENHSVSYSSGFHNGVALRDDLPPGRYTVSLDLPEDLFEKVPAQEIDVVAGESRKVEFVLRRK